LCRQLSTACAAVADLYMTDLCDEDGAEAMGEEWATRAVAVDESNPEALYSLGNLRLCQKRGPEALPFLKAAVARIEELCADDLAFVLVHALTLLTV
jgi:hypothetical protein